LIQDSRSDFEVQYLPSTSATFGYIRAVGGLIGEGPDVFTEMFVEIKRSRAKVKLHANPGFPDFDAMYWGGLIGYSHSSNSGSVKVTESTAEVDFDLRLPMGWPAGIYDSVKEIGGLLPSIGGVDPIVREVQDSYATGKILISSPTAQNISKIAGLSPVVSPWSQQMTITRAYSNVQLDLQLGTTDLSGVARPFVNGSPIIVNQSFYNSELMTPGIPQDSYASPRTTTQMQTAATWLNAGYSPDVWEIAHGSMPTLKNITVQFPGAPNSPAACPADINGDGTVGPADMTDLLASFGQSGASATDINGDGETNSADLSILLGSWGACP